MKLIRFKKSLSDSAQYGAVFNQEIRSVDGFPYGEYKIGAILGTVKDFMLLSPCVPGKIVALAANYRGASGVTKQMSEPIVFIKPATSITGPYDDIISPFKNINVWGECELGIVVGRQLYKATVQQVKEAIFGYVCANDVTAENIEGRDHHLVRSKGADTFCPIGPWIDTDFDPSDAKIQAYQNGKLIRQGNLRERIWKEEKVLSWLSQWLTLDPGDIILTGTPPRVVGKTFLKDNDIFEVKIEGLGSIRNRFISQQRV